MFSLVFLEGFDTFFVFFVVLGYGLWLWFQFFLWGFNDFKAFFGGYFLVFLLVDLWFTYFLSGQILNFIVVGFP